MIIRNYEVYLQIASCYNALDVSIYAIILQYCIFFWSLDSYRKYIL